MVCTREAIIRGHWRGGVGRAIGERLTERGYVVIVDRDADRPGWTRGRANVEAVIGDGADEATLTAAVDRAAAAGRLMGWVNNAAVFQDAAVHTAPVAEVLKIIMVNLALAVAGSAAAIRRFLQSDGRRNREHLIAPSAMTSDLTTHYAACTRSAESAVARRLPPWSTTFSPQRQALSPARSCPSMAAARHLDRTPEPATSSITSPDRRGGCRESYRRSRWRLRNSTWSATARSKLVPT
jgi:NAD(P)-dependent dehydrogenase (short-subunit alcohol dehydrogenase family)